MSITKGKFFDARKTREYCDTMKYSSKNYERIAGLAFKAYMAFHGNSLFHGITATALKGFINTRVGSMLTEVISLQDQMVRDQEYLISNFELMVDPHRNARIENDTLEMINTDFKGFYYELDGHANNVKNLVNALNSEFGHYANFPQPDSDSARIQFRQICGGEDDNAGYFRQCQKKLGDFDDTTTIYLKGRDTVPRAEALVTDIDNTSDSLSSYGMAPAKADKQTVVKLSAPVYGAAPSTARSGVVTASPMALTAVSPTLTATMDPSTTMAFEEFLRELESAGASPALIEFIVAMVPPALMEPTFWGEVLVGLLVLLALVECIPYAVKFIEELERQRVLESKKNKGKSGAKEKEDAKNPGKEKPHRRNKKGEMLGKNGPKQDSNSMKPPLKNGGRVDIENPKPGEVPGNVHFHDKGGGKWVFDPVTGLFYSYVTGELAPPYIQKLLQDPEVQRAIDKALRLLGEQPYFH